MIEKSRRKERAAALSEGYAKDTLSQTDRALVEQRRGMIRERKRAKAAVKEGGTERDWMGGVVVDLGFDALMTDQVGAFRLIRHTVGFTDERESDDDSRKSRRQRRSCPMSTRTTVPLLDHLRRYCIPRSPRPRLRGCGRR